MGCAVILLAAGQGRRMGRNEAKQFLPIGSLPMYLHSLNTFAGVKEITERILVVRSEDIEHCKEELASCGLMQQVTVTAGGSERYDSVYAGLAAVAEAEEVLIHDSARPFVDEETIRAVIKATREYGAATAAVPSTDTIKLADEEGFVECTLPRARTWNIQTPQGFRRTLLLEAYNACYPDHMEGITDDCMLIERLGIAKVKLVTGSYENRKITTASDYLEAVGKGRG